MSTAKDLDHDWMHLAVEEARRCISESGKNSPAVGVVFVNDGKSLASAHRGEIKAGEHAEYTAIQHKLSDQNINGSVVYTTLEPCTTRNHPKIPCAERLIENGVSEVVVGMLDPDPRIYNKGCERLRAAGVHVRYFPKVLRNTIEELNRPFIERFRANPKCSGRASFNYANKNGIFTIGHGDYLFETKWTKAGSTSIHVYNDPPSISRIAIAKGARSFKDVLDAGVYDFSSRHRSASEGQIVVAENKKGYFALIKIIEVLDDSRPPDDRDELVFEYRILTDGTSDFSVDKPPADLDP